MNHIKLPHQHGEGQQIALIQKQLDHVDYFQTVSEVFKQLGDTTRIRIFWLLCHQEECVLNISAMLDMSSPAVSHHLRPLRTAAWSSAAERERKFTTVPQIRNKDACYTK